MKRGFKTSLSLSSDGVGEHFDMSTQYWLSIEYTVSP